MDSNLILLPALIIWKVREAELSINFISTSPKKHPIVEANHWCPWSRLKICYSIGVHKDYVPAHSVSLKQTSPRHSVS